MTTATDIDPRLFMDLQGGRIACRSHLGGYGTTWLNAYPDGEITMRGRQVWLTPLDMWTVMTEEDRKEHAKSMAEYGFPDAVAQCEDCGYTPDDPEKLAAKLADRKEKQ